MRRLIICAEQGYSIIRLGYGVRFRAAIELDDPPLNPATALDLLGRGKTSQVPRLRIVMVTPVGSRRKLEMIRRFVTADPAINISTPVDWQAAEKPNQFRLTCGLNRDDFRGYNPNQGAWLTLVTLELRRLVTVILASSFGLRVQDVELKDERLDGLPRVINVTNRPDD